MADCTATLVTATVTDTGQFVELHTLRCTKTHRDEHDTQHCQWLPDRMPPTEWHDDTPGATPHTPTSAVTYEHNHHPNDCDARTEALHVRGDDR